MELESLVVEKVVVLLMMELVKSRKESEEELTPYCVLYWKEFVSFLQQMSPLVQQLVNGLGQHSKDSRELRPLFANLRTSLMQTKRYAVDSEDGYLLWHRKWKLSRLMERVRVEMAELVAGAWKVRGPSKLNGKIGIAEAALETMSDAIRMQQSDLASNVARQGREGDEGDQVASLTSGFVVGQDADASKVTELLLTPGGDYTSGVVSIVGFGGAGKSTLIEGVCRSPMVLGWFEGISVVVVCQNPDILACQKKIWQHLIGGELPDLAAQGVEATAMLLRGLLQNKRVLLLLDYVCLGGDVQHLNVINYRNGSKLMLTTRSPSVARELGGGVVELSKLSTEEATKLFCHHAFVRAQPPEHVMTEISDLVAECKKLPVVLELIGKAIASPAANLTVDEWRVRLRKGARKLRSARKAAMTPEEEVFLRLRLSFDSLSELEQQCLLMFGCFPKQQRVMVSDVVDLWSASRGINRDEGLIVWWRLVAASLVKWDWACVPGWKCNNSNVAMHVTGFQDVLSSMCYVHELVHDMVLRIAGDGYIVSRPRLFFPGCDLQFSTVVRSFPAEPLVEELSFAGMAIDDWSWNGRLPRLRVAMLRGTSLFAVPPSVSFAKQLRVLDMSFCNVESFPDCVLSLQQLELLQLDACRALKALPDEIGRLPQLSVMSLRFCSNLRALPESVGSLGQLSALYAPGCPFTELPSSFGCLKMLERLDLSYCERIAELPAGFGHLSSLRVLNLSGLSMLKVLPADFGGLAALEKLFIVGCLRLRQLPSSFSSLLELEELDMQICASIEALPDDIGALGKLKTLRMNWCEKLRKFPDSMESLTSLKVLGIDSEPVKFDYSTQRLEGFRSTCWLDRGYLPSGLVQRVHCGDVTVERPSNEQAAHVRKKIQGWSELHAALFQGEQVVAKLLFPLKGVINDGDQNGWTPLHWATRYGKIDSIGLLLSAGASPEAQCKNGWTALHYGAYFGQLDCADILLKAGASLEAQSKDGYTPLFVAVQTGRRNTVKWLLEKGANVDCRENNGATPMFVAAQQGDHLLVQLLAKKKADVDAAKQHGATPLFMAAQLGHLEAVKALLQINANVDSSREDGTTPLFVAAQNGHTEVVDLLLKNKAHTERMRKDGATALYVAAYNGFASIVELLLRNGANVDSSSQGGATPLFAAAQRGWQETVDALLRGGAAVDLPSQDGATPLFIASHSGHKAAAQSLLRCGAAVDSATKSGVTPLMIAAHKGRQEMVEFLVQTGASVHYRNKAGASALTCASARKHTAIADYLSQAGASSKRPRLACQKGQAC
ncbi:unnamed protein product [Ostreobium quekettii]|uniref:Uncharacterized protein n=1 Tax=Ostreobium quekettii TaxID=121088 RepID=A0A8S1INX3_9CHLO|nr:unnamed protein product [Ostreobium quekettii]|eukprot:evm.model.scf_103EXC.8 EVM.evm.TU.scf_103EXC.8   scf_103EXC:87142-100869(-)